MRAAWSRRSVGRVGLSMLVVFGTIFVPLSLVAPIATARADVVQGQPSSSPDPGPQEVTGPVGTLPGGSFPKGVTVVAELPNLRTDTSRTYLTSTGSRVLMNYAGPVNYKDSSGTFQPIDDTPVGNAGGGWHNKAGLYGATVPSSLGQPISVTAGSASVGFLLQSASSAGAPSPPADVSGSVKGDAVTFAKAFSGTDISYAFGNTGVNETVSLASATTPASYTWSLDPSAGLTPTLTPAGAIALDNADGSTAMLIDTPSITDANNLVGPPPTLSLAPDGTSMTISLAADAGWLADPARAFPVAVDPSVSVPIPQSSSQCQMWQSAPNTSECQSGTSYQIGDNSLSANAHTMFRFDNLTKLVPYDSLVQNSTFDVYEQGALNGNSIPVSLGTIANESWSSTQATWNQYTSGSAWANPGGDFTATPGAQPVDAGTANGWLNYDPVQQVQAWVNGADLTSPSTPPPASVNQGFMLTSDNSPNTVYVTNWASATTSQWPYLTVTYTPRIGTGAGMNILKTPLDDKTTLGVNAANGDLSVNSSLFDIQGAGLPLQISQTYDSMGGTETSLGTASQGAAWGLSSSFDEPELTLSGVYPNMIGNLNAADGTNGVFTNEDVFGTFLGEPPGINATLQGITNTEATVTFNQTGEVWTFDSIASNPDVLHLSSMHTRNGNGSGNLITYTYNAAGTMLTSVTDTEGRTVTIAYNTNNLVSSVTDSTGRAVSYTYSGTAGDERLATASYGGATTTYGYDSAGNLNKLTDPIGNITTMVYDSSQRVTSMTRVTNKAAMTGPTTTYAYTPSSAGSPGTPGSTKVTDPNGHPTTYSYDPWDRVSTATDALGHAESSSYNAQSDPTTLTNGLTQITKLQYDTNNSLNKITSPPTATGQTPAASTYDFNTPQSVNGGTYLPSSGTDAQQNCASFTYDANGNQTGIYEGFATGTNCDGETSGTGVTSVTDGYQGDGPSCNGKAGELCTTTSGAGNVTNYSYDSQGQLIQVVQPGGNCQSGSRSLCTTITYDGLSRPSTVTDGKGQETTYTYDSWDRITQILYNGTTTCRTSAGTCIRFTYDADGNVLNRVDQSGKTIFHYDMLNRLTEEDLPNATDSCSGFSGMTYSYDAASNLTAYCDAGGAVTYAYNAANLDVGVATGTGSCTPGAVVQPCTAYTYNAANQLTNITYPTSTGVTDTLGYDGAGHQTSEVVAKGGTNLSAEAYNYANGTSDMQLQHAAFNFNTGLGTTYSYDTQDRLSGASETGSGATNYSYTYDADGNLTYETAGYIPVSYAYNASDALCWSVYATSSNACANPPSGATRYSYDGDGNQTGNSAGEAISYNSVNQTTSMTPAGGSALSMAYTGTDSTQRTSAGPTTFANNTFGVAESTTNSTPTYFTRDANGRLNSITVGGAQYYVYYNGAGSIAGFFNTSGTNMASYSYDPYGGTTPGGTDPSYNPFRYKGGYEDSTGFYKFGTRYYAPGTASWTQQDSMAGTIQSPGTINRYAYAGDDSVNEVDPSGYCSLFGCIAEVANLVVGTIAGSAVGVLCEGASFGLATLECGALGIGTGVIITDGLNAYDTYLQQNGY